MKTPLDPIHLSHCLASLPPLYSLIPRKGSLELLLLFPLFQFSLFFLYLFIIKKDIDMESHIKHMYSSRSQSKGSPPGQGVL